VSTAYLTGVKSAIAEYYNDQIREIYAEKPDQAELKEVRDCLTWVHGEGLTPSMSPQLFKVARDEELVFVDAHTPDALDPNKHDEDPVRSFARTSTKVLLQVATRV
jgi:hypothetical protein